MAKLIDVEEAISELKKLIDRSENFSPRLWPGGRSVTALKFIIGWLEKRPVVDAAPVVHARWKADIQQWGETSTPVLCSVCGRRELVGVHNGAVEDRAAEMYPYCHCGAKMDLKGE